MAVRVDIQEEPDTPTFDFPRDESTPKEVAVVSPATPSECKTKLNQQICSIHEKLHPQELQKPANSYLNPQIVLAFLAFILIGANDGALGVLLPSLQTYYDVDRATVGLPLLSGAAGYLLAAFSNGLMAQKLGTRQLLLLGATSFFIGQGMFSLKLPFTAILFTPLFLGLGASMMEASLNAYIARMPNNTALLNYLHAFYGFGALLSPVIASWLISVDCGWNSIYSILASACVVLLIGFGTSFKVDNNNFPAGEFGLEKVPGNVLGDTLKQRVVWIVALFMLFYVGSEITLGNWSFSILTEERHQSELLSGSLVSGYWLGLTLGRLALAPLSSRISDQWLIRSCLMGVVTGVLLLWLVPLAIASAVGLLLTGFSLGPINPTATAMISNLIPPRVLLCAISLIAGIGSLGKALIPWLAGHLAQGLGLGLILPYVVVLTGGMMVCWLALQVRYNVFLSVDPENTSELGELSEQSVVP